MRKQQETRMKEDYERLDPISHILRRPDMYIGSLQPEENIIEWIEQDDKKLESTKLEKYSNGLIRLFIEVLSNAVDNVWRSKQGERVSKIVIEEKDDEMTIWNDGKSIPIQKKDDIYIPEMIFGHLLSGSNMNDTKIRYSSGRNGIGVKLVNVFSKEFWIEIEDDIHQKRYTQRWTDHMRICHPPEIKQRKIKKGSIKIGWKTDFSFFGTSRYDKKTLRFLLYPLSCMIQIPFYWNQEKIEVKQFREFLKSIQGQKEKERVFYEETTYQYAILGSEIGSRIMTFTNGIYNREGGTHMDTLQNEVYKKIITKCHQKKWNITNRDLKNEFIFVLFMWIPNPEFSNQSKTRFLRPNVSIEVPDKSIQEIMKWSFTKEIKTLCEYRESVLLKKVEKKTRKELIYIENLDSANLSGTKRSKECTLILCEGLSAKTYATLGIQIGWKGKKGRDYFGIYPLRGKCLNVRNATSKTISENREVCDIIRALNLKKDVDYTQEKNYESLLYGNIMVMTDADEDGHHICALLLNLFHHLFPSLFERKEPFFYYMMTPIAKVFRSPKQIYTFYSDFEYQQFKKTRSDRPNLRTKYYKGLGTSCDEEIKETFGQKVVCFEKDETSDELLYKIFHKSQSQERKDWMTQWNPGTYQIPQEIYKMTDYLNQEMMRFSLQDCRRSIPYIFDGLKVSQRKILYAIFKKNLHEQQSLKVAQFAGYCAEVSNYHHGEQCLHDTIIRMAQTFIGSNNVPYFVKDGQFGSRSYGGKDAANARYISTRPHRWTRLLFPKEDDILLSYTLDDGQQVQPDHYVPIVPMILVNGCHAGIGTGWSCFIPSFSIHDIIRHIRIFLREGSTDISSLLPYFHGFKGEIECISKGKYESRGILTSRIEKKKMVYEITELPVFTWTNKYKEELESLVEQKKITQLRNYSTPNDVHFIFQTVDDHSFEPNLDTLKLRSSFSIHNMVLFYEWEKLKKFTTIQEIFDSFVSKRMELYKKRKLYCLQQQQDEYESLQNQLRFIQWIRQDPTFYFTHTEDEIHSILESMSFRKKDNSYSYLLQIPIHHFTQQKEQEWTKKCLLLKEKVEFIQHSTEQDFWEKDLQLLEKVL
jgi:DNA topoisomerase-2